jgi:hypothetical protein
MERKEDDQGRTNFCRECVRLQGLLDKAEALLAEVGRARMSADGIDATIKALADLEEIK